MPFESDIRCGWCQIQLNKCYIAQLFRDYEKEVIFDYFFDKYVEALEFELNKVLNCHFGNFNWFSWWDNNFDSVPEFNELNYEDN